ncbi:MAG: hypothetical protein RR057_05075, partial [Clostridia bacterium]
GAVTPNDLNLGTSDNGLTRPVVIDGKASKCFMESAGMTPRDISAAARKSGTEPKNILYMTIDDKNNAVIKEKGDTET